MTRKLMNPSAGTANGIRHHSRYVAVMLVTPYNDTCRLTTLRERDWKRYIHSHRVQQFVIVPHEYDYICAGSIESIEAR